MTEPSQYFKGRTVQEQMNEVIGYVDVRSAEVATTAIASDVAQVHQDMLDADADAQAAAASAAAAAGTLANAVKKTGEASQSIAGNIAVAGNLSGGTVTVPTPVNNTDAANKKYVDDADTAMKTYVDNQDATKVAINDIDSYAVGLTGAQENIAGVKGFLGEVRRIVTGNYMRGILTKLDKWKIGEAPTEQVTYWPLAVSDTPITDFPLLVAMSETMDGRDILGFECKGQHGLAFGLRIVCTSSEVALYLVSENTIQLVSRITR